MTRLSARVLPVLVLLLAGRAAAQAQKFPAFDPERIFMLGDADLDGRLSLDEFRELYRSSPRMKNAAATIEPLFRRLDTDRDGFLSLREYRKFFPQRPGGATAKAGVSKEKPPAAGAPGAPITPEQQPFQGGRHVEQVLAWYRDRTFFKDDTGWGTRVVCAALRSVHGAEKIEAELSGYYVADEIAGTYRGMMIAIPAEEWLVFGSLTMEEWSVLLRALASHVQLDKFRKHPRGAKKPRLKRQSHKRKPHVSTAKLLAERGSKRE